MRRVRIDRGPFADATKRALARQLRREATPIERYAWSLLRNRSMLGLKFRRQHVIGQFVVDFYCPALRLALELDGGHHAQPGVAGYDAARSASLAARGVRVLRLRNRDLSAEGLARLLRPIARRVGICPASPLSACGEGDRG